MGMTSVGLLSAAFPPGDHQQIENDIRAYYLPGDVLLDLMVLDDDFRGRGEGGRENERKRGRFGIESVFERS